MKRIPGIDGLRAISILMVVVAHAAHGTGIDADAGPLTRVLLNAFGNAGLGVEVFFVISGYLITTLLLKEWDRTGSLSLKQFYLRRLFRIVPAYYFYLLVIALVALATPLDVSLGDLLRAATFTWNYSPDARSWTLAHTWSLSVEEQFYLLWPLGLLVALRKPDRALPTRIALGLVLLAPLLRLGTWALGHPDYSRRLMFSMLHTRIDALMFGCWAALAWKTPRFERLLSITDRLVPGMVLVLAASPYLRERFGGAYLYVFGYSLEGACITFIMAWLVRHPQSMAARLLETRPVVHVGLLSYSLYLWQEVFLDRANTSALGRWPLNVVAMIAAAELSYLLVEKYFLDLRARLFERRTPAPSSDTGLAGAGEPGAR